MVQLSVPVVKIESRKELKRIWTSNQEKKKQKNKQKRPVNKFGLQQELCNSCGNIQKYIY